jgi:hypothetical protein
LTASKIGRTAGRSSAPRLPELEGQRRGGQLAGDRDVEAGELVAAISRRAITTGP